MKKFKVLDANAIRTAIGRFAVVDRRFQFRYTGYLIGLTLLIGIVISALNLYFLNQNYTIFLDLSLTHFPKIMEQLERERLIMNALIGGSLLGSIFFCFLFGLRFTGQLVMPLVVLREHLKSAARGHWFNPEVRIRHSDEFQELVDSYNYFYKAIQLQARNDLRKLETLKAKSADPKAKSVLDEMIEEKTQQLSPPN